MLNMEEKKSALKKRLQEDFNSPEELYNTLKSFTPEGVDSGVSAADFIGKTTNGLPETKGNKMTKYIYTPTTHRAAKAIFDNGEYTLRVEVNKVAGTAMYTYFINGKADHNVTRIDAVSSWEDVADWLGAELIITEQKQLTKSFEDYKIWIKEAKEKRKRVKLKEENDTYIGLFSGEERNFGEE